MFRLFDWRCERVDILSGIEIILCILQCESLWQTKADKSQQISVKDFVCRWINRAAFHSSTAATAISSSSGSSSSSNSSSWCHIKQTVVMSLFCLSVWSQAEKRLTTGSQSVDTHSFKCILYDMQHFIIILSRFCFCGSSSMWISLVRLCS